MDNRWGEKNNKFTTYAALAICLAVLLFLIVIFASNRQPAITNTSDLGGQDGVDEPTQTPEAVQLEQSPLSGEETPAQKAHGR